MINTLMDAIGKIVVIDADRFRVLPVRDDAVPLCRMDTDKLDMYYIPITEFERMLRNQEVGFEEETPPVFRLEDLTPEQYEEFLQRRNMMFQITEHYGPSYIGLSGKGHKDLLKRLEKEMNCSRPTLWKWIRRYLQSGCNDVSLLDKRVAVAPKAKRPRLCNYTVRPTYWQFYYYCKKRLSIEEKDAIKTSRAEQRNNNRLLLASSRIDAIRPGWIVEVDAWEADVSIVSQYNPEQCIGRPIVYFMVDVYSRAIVAMSVSLENNSIQGITNLMINLIEEKKKYTSRFGIGEFDENLWPSEFIPHEIRCDRGAEVRSDVFGKICNRLGITRTLEPPAMGSMKGLVEQSFHQLNASIRTALENKGLITKQYDSSHHREAMLTLADFTTMVITFVVTHNEKFIMDFLPSKEMMDDEDFQPIPAVLWKYGCKKYGLPRMINETNRMQYFFDMLPEKTASITRSGIIYNGLRYINHEDTILLRDMYVAKDQRSKIMVRIDPQDVAHLYYIRENKPQIAILNPGYPEQMSYSGLTWPQYEEYRKQLQQWRKEGKAINLQIEVDRMMVNQTIISKATTEHLASDTDLKAARRQERYASNNANRLSQRIQETSEKAAPVEQPQEAIQPVPSEPNPFASDDDLRTVYQQLKNQRRN